MLVVRQAHEPRCSVKPPVILGRCVNKDRQLQSSTREDPTTGRTKNAENLLGPSVQPVRILAGRCHASPELVLACPERWRSLGLT